MKIHGNYNTLVGHGYDKFWNDKHFWRVVKGSRGSKKSKTTALNLIYRMVQPQNQYANILCVRKNRNTLRQSCYSDLKFAINKLGLTALFKYNESMPEITYKPTGQKILFRGLNDPLSLTSITVDTGILAWVWIEEAYEISNWSSVQTLSESIRGVVQGYPNAFKQITLTFNPWSKDHWLRTKFFDAQDDGKDTREDDRFTSTTTYKVNEWLSKKDISRLESLRRTDPKRAKVALDGDWGILDGQVFTNWQEGIRGVNDMFNHGGQEIYGLDFGFKHDPTALICAVVDDRNKELYIYDGFYLRGLLTDDIVDNIKSLGYGDKRIVCDSAEQRLITEIRNKGIHRAVPASKPKGSIVAGISQLQEYTIIINPRLDNVIKEFNNYVYEKDIRTGQTINKPVDANNHAIDALRYGFQAIASTVKLHTMKGY